MEELEIGNYQKVSIEDILKKDVKFSVSYFQRDYSWGKNEWSKFFDDIQTSLNEKRKHFFGFMTFLDTGKNKEVQIIEGQQRLATVTILTAVIRDIFYERGNEKWKDIDSKLIKAKDLYTDDVFYKLKLSDINQSFFEEYIQREGKPKEKIEKMKKEKSLKLSNRLIRECYTYFYDKIKNKEDRELLDILQKVTKEFIVITTEVTNLHSAYILFQTLNNRGLDLTLSDLLKTHLLQKAGEDWSEIKKDWDFILTLPEIDNVNIFLRHYWLSTRGVVKEEELFDKLSSEIKTKEDAFKFIKELKKEAEIYSNLLNPKPEYFNGDKDIVELLRDELYVLSKQMVLPILLAAYGRLKVNELKSLIKATINFVFRYLTIGEQENKELERLFSDIAIAIRNNKIKDTKSIVAEFRKKDIDDKTFEGLFKVKQIKQNNKAVYILKKIEEYLSKQREKFHADITLEHILPLNPDEECKKYMKENNLWEDRDEIVYRLGNMTLLLGSVNRKAQNKSPIKKSKEIYSKQTKLMINKDLKNIKKWTVREIDKRQEKFAKYALHIWKL